MQYISHCMNKSYNRVRYGPRKYGCGFNIARNPYFNMSYGVLSRSCDWKQTLTPFSLDVSQGMVGYWYETCSDSENVFTVHVPCSQGQCRISVPAHCLLAGLNLSMEENIHVKSTGTTGH